MRERILLFIILSCLGVFLYIFQNYVNTVVGFVILCVCMVIYGLYSIAATKYQKRKLKKHPPVINENYKPFISILFLKSPRLCAGAPLFCCGSRDLRRGILGSCCPRGYGAGIPPHTAFFRHIIHISFLIRKKNRLSHAFYV